MELVAQGLRQSVAPTPAPLPGSCTGGGGSATFASGKQHRNDGHAQSEHVNPPRYGPYDAAGCLFGSVTSPCAAAGTAQGVKAIDANTVQFVATSAITGNYTVVVGSGAAGPQGAAGNNGNNGTNGAGFSPATSTTSLNIATGSTSFTTQSGLAYQVNAFVRSFQRSF